MLKVHDCNLQLFYYYLAGRATFTSSRSMEIEVVVDSKDYVSGIAV